ncbi:PLxRFG domain-containing protein [Aquabacterium sp.]|uniref:PLxRFG domain-containing protein n=1 Tax=Aquabacterium sp. TaxID=1872578 RepID=UPI003783E187
MATLFDMYGLTAPDEAEQPANRPSHSVAGGLKRSFAELPEVGSGVLAYGADAMGATGTRDKLLGYAQRKQEDIAAKYPAASFSEMLEGKVSPADFLADATGYVAGQLVQSLATGGLTALGFKTLAKGAAMQAAKTATERAVAAGLAHEAAKQVGLDAAETVLTRALRSGAITGAGAHNVGQELGSIFLDAEDEARQQGRELDAGDRMRIGLSALAAAAVDTAMEGVNVGRAMRGGRGASFGSRLAREVPAGMAREGSTEAIQTGIEHYGAGQPIADDKGLRDIIDSAAVGAVGGGLAGGGASLHRSPAAQSLAPAPTEQPLAPAVDVPMTATTAGPTGMQKLASGTTIDEVIAGAHEVADVPLTGGLSAGQEARALDSLDRQAQRDMDAIRQAGRSMSLDEQRRSPAPPPTAAASASVLDTAPFGDRVLTLREQLADPSIRDQLRALDPQAFSLVSQYAGIADRPDINMPEKTRERLLGLAEMIMSRAVAQPLETAQPGPSATRVAAGPALTQPASVPRLELDTAPTGAIRVDSTGSAAPETRADVISTKQRVDAMRKRPDGFEQQVQGRPLPRDFTLVGDGTLTPGTMPAREPGQLPALPNLPGKRGAFEAAERDQAAAAARKPDELDAIAAVKRAGEAPAPTALGEAMRTAIDRQANEAATSLANAKPDPTEAQKKAGNYQLGHIRISGLDISVENPAGSTRSGVDPNGKPWSTTMAAHYGYFKRTRGADGDHVDVFVKPGTDSDFDGPVFVVDQVDPDTRAHDEHKVVLGAKTREEAEAIYRANYDRDWQGLGAMTRMSLDRFKEWLADGDTTKPLATDLQRRVEATRRPSNGAAGEQGGLLPKAKLAELVKLTQRSREDVAAQYVSFVQKHGQAKADQMLDRALQVARERPKPAPAVAPAAPESAAPAAAARAEPAPVPNTNAAETAPQPQAEHAPTEATGTVAPTTKAAPDRAAKRVRGRLVQQEVDMGLARVRELRAAGRITAAEAMEAISSARSAGEPADAAAKLADFLREKDRAPVPDAEPPRQADASRPRRSSASPANDAAALRQRLDRHRAIAAELNAGRSMTTSLGRVDLTPDDRSAIMRRAAELRTELARTLQTGVASAAAKQAVAERIDAMRAELVKVDPSAADEKAGEPESTPPAASKIEDAGEKIGGARKDRWAERGLDVSDLDAMAEGEGAELATKANVWKPDYQAIAAQAEPVTAAMVKVVYDSLAAKPRQNTPQGRRDYVRAMQAVRKVYGAVRSVQEAKDAYQRLRAELGVPAVRMGLSELSEDQKAARRALFSVYKGRSDPFVYGYNELQRAKALVQDGFPGSIEPWTRRFVIRALDGAGVTDRGLELIQRDAAASGTPLTAEQIHAGYFEVRDKAGRAQAYLPTRADAEQAAKALYEATKGKGSEKAEPERPHLDKIVREGMDQAIDRDATPQDLLDTFGFRGVEWGNWSAQDERQRILNLAYDALSDLAKIMNVPRKALSLNGTLGMAFGARGGGRFAAHYEPGKLVINMTKLRGAGSLAHEWAHALDHYLGEIERSDAYQGKARGASGWYGQRSYTGRDAPANLRPELASAIDRVMRRLFEGTIDKPTMLADLQAQHERTQALAARETDPKLKAVYTDSLAQQQRRIAEVKAAPDDTTYPRGKSDYAQQAQKLSGKSADGYWLRPTEMWARAFESYVFDRLVAMGAKSEYLVHGVEQDRFADTSRFKGNPYPSGAERAAINKAFDAFVSELKTREDDAGRVALFSRAAGDDANALRALSENDELFALPKSNATTVEGIAADIDPEIKITPRKIPGETRYDLTMPDGKTARLIVRKPNPYGPTLYGFDQVDGEMSNVFEGRPGENPEAVPAAKEDVYIDASLLESGGAGAKVYQIAAIFAHNTGRIFIGDPAGLSDEALRRRTEQMLSSALKFGTTEHLAPHPRQTAGDKALGVPPLKWVYGDDLGNIRRMVELNLQALDNAGYGDSVISFDPGAGRFRDSGGEFLSRADIDALAKEAGLGRRGQAGGTTLARGAVLRALLREEGREGAAGRGRDGLLARLAGLGGDAAQATQGIFYSRDPEAVRGLSRAEAEAVLALPQALIDRLLGRRPSLEQLRDVVSRADGLDVQVAQSVDDLPAAQRKKLSARVPNGNVRGVYFPDIDRIWLIADHLHSEAEATFVLLHEAFHRGLAKTFGPDARRVLRQMYHTNGRLQKLTKEQMQTHGIGQDEAIEEALADLAGRGEARDLKGWQRLVDIIRRWLGDLGRALGFELRWTDDMVEDFVAGTARAGLQGEPHVSAAAATASRSETTRRRYLNESKSPSFGGPSGLQLPRVNRPPKGSEKIVRTQQDLVNLRAQQGGEPRFSRTDGPTAAQDLVNAKGGVFDFNRLGATQQDRVRTVVDGSRSFWLGALTRDQLADIYGREMPQVKDYDALTRAMENERSKIAQDADALYNEWAKLDSDANDRLARVMLDATVHSVHPDGEFTTIKGNDAATEDERRKVHKRLRREFAELPDAAQAMYGKVRDFHAGMLEQLKAGLEHRIERQVKDGKARAATLTSIRQAFDQYKEHGPYFPLSRFGDFLVIGTREDGERVVASYETAGEQATAARALRQDGFTVKMKTAKQYTRALDGSAGRFAGDVLALLNGLDLSEATLGGKATDLKTRLMDDVNQLFIRALPDLSYRRHFAHRQNTPGFSADVMRGFASSAFHGASHIARLNYADRMSFALEDAYRAIERADDGDFNKHTQVLNELALRHDAAMNPNTHPFAALLNQVGFIMYLGASPAAGLVNLLQTPMITLPYLGARHGFGKAAAGLAKATKDILAAKANRQSGWNAVDSPKLTEAERETMRKLQDEGVIDLTQAHDLSAATGLDTGNVARSKAAFAMSRAMKIVGWTFHVPEVMNRQATALAAYRLEMEASGDQAKAEDAAREAIKRTHFDYSSSNRARYMQGNLARVVLQFKQYAQNMTYLLGRAAYQALKDEDPAVRSVARRQLVATLGATFAMAGALGLPAVGVIGQLVGALVGALDDDDKPWDWKAELRNLLADTFGKEAGEVLAHGLPRALMPWDVANRVGMSDLWFRSNDREGQSPREAFANDMANILGPSAGTLLGWYTAADQMARGNWSKAAEAITPKFVRDVLQASRMATEGVTSYKGEHVMDLTPAESLGKLLGFTPARVSETYEAMATVKNAETAVLDRRKLLIGKAARARMEGDGEAAAEAAAEIAEFNRRNPAERIKGEAIVASVLARRRHERETADGVSLPPARDHFREAGRFAVTQ